MLNDDKPLTSSPDEPLPQENSIRDILQECGSIQSWLAIYGGKVAVTFETIKSKIDRLRNYIVGEFVYFAIFVAVHP